MSIRLATNCTNCNSLSADSTCNTHAINVSGKHTCDSFSMKALLKDSLNCTTCSRYNQPSCKHPESATPEMLCSKWAPKAMVA